METIQCHGMGNHVRKGSIAAICGTVAVATVAGAWSATSGVWAVSGIFPQAHVSVADGPAAQPVAHAAAAAPATPQLAFAKPSPLPPILDGKILIKTVPIR